MTDTETITKTDTGDEPSTDRACEFGAVGELSWVDPRSLIVGVNIRDEAQLERRFVRDIAERGVREPITVRYDDEGRLVVRKGKRRTLAAVEAGCERVRVFIEPEPVPAAGDAAGQIERIVDQLGENAHRSANTDAEQVRAHQELLELGLSAGQIARRTHTSTKRVRVTTAVARSELACAVLARYDLTLEQVAVIAEFDDHTDDGVEAVQLLTVTSQRDPGQFAHLAQRLRDRREDQQLRAARIAELTKAAVRIIDPVDPTGDSAGTPSVPGPRGADPQAGTGTTGAGAALSTLRASTETPHGTALTEAEHASCPGHAASVEVERGWRTGEPTVVTTWWCTDPDVHGHSPRWDRPAGGVGVGVGERTPGPMSEQEKTERRRVILHNKNWDSASTVRKEWLTTFLARRSAPKDAGRYIADTLAKGSHDVRRAMENAHPTACALLGLDAPGSHFSGEPNPITVALATATAARLTVISLAVLLGAAEDGTSRNSWRHPTSDTQAYFTVLAGWGYPLSPVEQLVCHPDADRTAAAAGAADQVDSESNATPTADASADDGTDQADQHHIGAAVGEEGSDAA